MLSFFSIAGVGTYLKSKNPNVKVVLADPEVICQCVFIRTPPQKGLEFLRGFFETQNVKVGIHKWTSPYDLSLELVPWRVYTKGLVDKVF